MILSVMPMKITFINDVTTMNEMCWPNLRTAIIRFLVYFHLSTNAFSQLSQERPRLFFRRGECESNVCFVDRVDRLQVVSREDGLDCGGEFVGVGDVECACDDVFDDLALIECGPGGGGVGADEAACAEFCASVVAGDDDDGFDEVEAVDLATVLDLR